MARRTHGAAGSEIQKGSTRGGREQRSAVTPVDGGGTGSRMPVSLLVSLIALVADTLAVYGRVPRFNFLDWDDNINIYANPYFSPNPQFAYFWNPHNLYHGFYIPMTYTLWGLLIPFARRSVGVAMPVVGQTHLDPSVFHAANLTVHLLNTFLVFFLLRRLVRSDWASLAGALLFAIHPVQVEAVAWITEMKGLLATLFALIALNLYVENHFAATRPRQALFYGLSTLAFVLAVLSKPSATILPFVAVLIDLLILRRPSRPSLARLAPWLAFAIVFMVLTHAAQPVTATTPLWTRPFIACDSLLFYLGKLVLPINLSPDYGRKPATVMAMHWVYVEPLVLILLGALLWRLRRHRALIASAGILVVSVAPVLGLVPFDFQIYSTVSDRYLYLAMLGPALAVAWLLSGNGGVDQTGADIMPRAGETGRRLAVTGGLACAALLALAVMSAQHVGDYRNDMALYRHTVQVNPRSWMAHNNLSQELDFVGDHDASLQEAITAYACEPDVAELQRRLGQEYIFMSRYAEGIAPLEAANSKLPDDNDADYSLGLAYFKTGRYADALAILRPLIARDPGRMQAYDTLGATLIKLGRDDDAIGVWSQAIQVDPNYATAHFNLGATLGMRGRRAEAIAQFQDVLRLDPGNAGAQSALTSLQHSQTLNVTD